MRGRPFSGKTVLVTGASSGIGEATARLLAARGARLVLVARRRHLLESLAAQIAQAGGEAVAFASDLSDPADVAALARAVRAVAGTPDVLVHNAGAGRWLTLEEGTPGDLVEALVPYLAAAYVTQAFLPGMLARGSGGIALLTSPASYVAWPGACGYVASRHALRGFAEALRADLSGSGIAISLLVLGKVASPYWEHNPGSEARIPALIERLIPALTVQEAAELQVAALGREVTVMRPWLYRVLLHPWMPLTLTRWCARYRPRAASAARSVEGRS